MNIILIKEFSALTNGNVEKVNSIVFTNFKGYDFSGNNGGVIEYAVGFSDGESFIPLSNGECILPYEVVANWGSDDSIIFDYVISQKGFIKI